MNKYSKILSGILRKTGGILCILFGVALFGVSIWGSFTIGPAFSMILIIAVLGGGFIINAGLGFGFLGDEYTRSDYIHEGETMLEVVETPKLLKRRMLVTFLACVAYVLLTIYYIVMIILNAKADAGNVMAIMIGCAIVSLIAAVIFFLISASIKTSHFKNDTQNKIKTTKSSSYKEKE
jgi:hypothetical protein